MKLFWGAPALWGAASLLCPPSLLNSEYLLQFNLFVPIPGRKEPLGHIPILLSLTQPQSRGCVGALGVGGFVLYLLLQLGEPQETPAFFYVIKMEINSIFALSLSVPLSPACVGGRQSGQGVGTQGQRQGG